MRQLILVLLFLLSFSTFSQIITDTIVSQKLKQDREFTVSLPESYAKNKTKKYPILVLLDGDYLLNPFQGALFHSEQKNQCPFLLQANENFVLSIL